MRLGLLDLLAPQFLIDFRLPDEIHDIIAFLRVSELESTWDQTGVVHTGKATFEGEGAASPVPVQKKPTGEVFEWGDVNVEFRLTIPRAGSADLKTVVDTAAGVAPATSPIRNLQATLNSFGVPTAGAASDYPGFAFRLELLLSAITLHLPKSQFVPARLAADGWLEPDSTFTDVRFVLPKVAVVVTRDNQPLSADADFEGWGITGLDDDLDPAAGELIAMVPPLCLHESGVFGFGLEKAVLDLSADHTPPEILELFGTGDDFQGLWLPHVRIFVAPKRTTGLAFDVRAQDLLIDFREGVSGEFGLDIVNRVDGKLKVQARFFEGGRMILPTQGSTLPANPNSPNTTKIRGSRVSVAADGELQLAISGGQPPYTVTVTEDEKPISADPPNGSQVRWPLLPDKEVGTYTLSIVVQDSSVKKFIWDEEIELALRKAGHQIGSLTTIPFPTLSEGIGTDGYRLLLGSSQPDTGAVLLQALPAWVKSVTATAVDASDTPVGTPTTLTSTPAGEIRVPVTLGGPSMRVTAAWPTSTVTPADPFQVDFEYEVPNEAEIVLEVARVQTQLAFALGDFVARAAGRQITIEAQASYEGNDSKAGFNQKLSERRAEVLRQVLSEKGAQIGPITPTGFTKAKAAYETNKYSYVHEKYRNAIATYSVLEAPAPAPSRVVKVVRPAPQESPLITPTERGPTPLEPERPPFFRKIALRVRLERSRLVLFEISGEVDIQTAAEDRADVIRAGANTDGKHPEITNTTETGLTVTAQPNASADPKNNPGDGIVDYRFTLTYDTATRRLTEELAFGAGETDRDGLVHITNAVIPGPPRKTGIIGNVAGALLIFAPLLAKSIDSAVTAQGGDATVPMTLAAAEIAAAATLGLTGAVSMQKIMWFGAELSSTQTLATDTTLDEIALLLDYGVDFAVNIDVGGLKIQSKPDTPLRVRYRAIGFKLNFGQGKVFSPVFDTSRGYELDLADPGLFDIGEPLGNILKVLGARVAKTNPTVVELDLGMKVNLGVITVDSLRVTWPLDPAGPPTLLPTGVSVNIPGVLTGRGFLDLRDGVKGSLDLTLVPVKLRIAGGIGIESLKVPGRNVTAVIVTLQIEFPTAIPLANSGIGLYGILGLFAMHYKRNEDPSKDVPALDWLNTKVKDGNPTDIQGWEAAVDRWAFGVGAVLGTLGSGTILNLKGMLVLELPGPRILIFVRLQILTKQPPTEGKVEAIGITAVVDLDFELHKLTIGVLIAYDIDASKKSLISLRIPVEARFDFDDASDWHLHIGSIQTPASALVLNIVRASGYLMFAGDEIKGFPVPPGPPPEGTPLPGFAIALGIRAAVTLGDESIGLYLKVSARLDAALVFSPFHVYGLMDLRGQLRLFIISISAWATLTVDAPDPTIVHGEACASLDLFFFTLEGCIEIHIGPKDPAILEPPDLVLGMALQSRSPALVQSQGTDRPIDGKLGDALEVKHISGELDPKQDPQLVDKLKEDPNFKFLVVPIDAVPLLKLHAAPSTEFLFTFTLDPGTPPRSLPDGWMEQGGGRAVRYSLSSLTLTPRLPVSPEGPPPAAWRANTKQQKGQDTAVDLALFSWDPVSDARAYQRSGELTERIAERWSGVCDPVAAPVPVLWTFNSKPLGPATGGWHLTGAALPDPPNTQRSAPPDLALHVHGPAFDPLLATLQAEDGQGHLEAATVIGIDDRPGANSSIPASQVPGRVLQLPFRHPRKIPPKIDIPKVTGDVLGAAPQDVSTSASMVPADPHPERIIVESGAFERAQVLLAYRHGLPTDQLVFRAFDAGNKFIHEIPVFMFPNTLVRSLADLPQEWKGAGPWAQDVTQVMDFLDHLQDYRPGFDVDGLDFTRRLVTYTPAAPQAVRFEIMVRDRPLGDPQPLVLVGAIEILRTSEVARKVHDEEVRTSEIKTIEGALTAGQHPRPLLAPNTRYTISLNYTASVRQNDLESPNNAPQKKDFQRTQHFTFVTDDKPPKRLNPWVLATTPSAGEPVHFVDDPVRIIFNDASAVQLFEAYGKSLRAVVRQANGNHPKDPPTPVTKETLAAVEASILTPFADTLLQLIMGNEAMGCVQIPAKEHHSPITVAVELDRATAYTLDIEADPPELIDPRAPLFRIAFTTSRFRSAAELAEVMRGSKIKQRILSQALASLPDNPTDSELEEALVKAGLEALPALGDSSITLLWQPVGTDFTLTALLIDAPEPLWRLRQEPELVTEESEAGPMQHVVDTPHLWLEVVEVGTASAQQLIRSPGGTRGLVILKPGAKELKLFLRQHELPLLTRPPMNLAPLHDSLIFSADLPPVAPWRLDDD